jgi:hypothetical protein
LCITCSSDSSCGQVQTEITCKTGNVIQVINTPKCSSGCCLTASSYTIKTECQSSQVCLAGACVTRNETAD